MPVFATPWLFGAAVAAAVAVTALHLLSVRTPPPLAFPTARFVADGEARAVARQPRLNDIGLLLLRVFAVLLIGAALAGVRWADNRASVLHLVVADEHWAADTVWRDSLSRARSGNESMLDLHFARGVALDPGAALIAAIQRAAWLTARYPALSRVELTIALPPSVETRSGYAAWRTQWPGAVRLLVRDMPAASDSAPLEPGVVTVEGVDRDDAVAAAMRAATAPAGTMVRVVRGSRATSVIDSRNTSGRGTSPIRSAPIEVDWPREGVPRDWTALPIPDTVAALAAEGHAIVGPFVRAATPSAVLQARIDSGQAAARPVRAIAWWGDGSIAATEEAGLSGSCTRAVAIRVPTGSDLLLTEQARGLLHALSAPCGAAHVASRTLDDGRATADTVAALASAFRGLSAQHAGSDPWWLTPALLAAAMMLLALEWAMRDRTGDA